MIRLILSIIMLFLFKDSIPFLTLFILCGVSDFADGFIARRLQCETELGAKLDSLADFCFFFITCYALAIHIPINALLISSIAIVIIIRLMNLILTKIKFKQFAVIHTFLNKFTGFQLFIIYPIILFGSSFVSVVSLFILIFFAMLSSLEEMIIILKSNQYNINLKSILVMMKNKRT